MTVHFFLEKEFGHSVRTKKEFLCGACIKHVSVKRVSTVTKWVNEAL